MTVEEIKKIIIDEYRFLETEAEFADNEKEYLIYKGAQEAIACILHDISVREEKENA